MRVDERKTNMAQRRCADEVGCDRRSRTEPFPRRRGLDSATLTAFFFPRAKRQPGARRATRYLVLARLTATRPRSRSHKFDSCPRTRPPHRSLLTPTAAYVYLAIKNLPYYSRLCMILSRYRKYGVGTKVRETNNVLGRYVAVLVPREPELSSGLFSRRALSTPSSLLQPWSPSPPYVPPLCVASYVLFLLLFACSTFCSPPLHGPLPRRRTPQCCMTPSPTIPSHLQ